MKVYLGGTCNGSKWREELIPKLKIDYFNPIVENWTSECKQRELEERRHADYCLYVITPLMTGTYSIAEVVDDSNKKPKQTLFCILNSDGENNEYCWKTSARDSLCSVEEMVAINGGKLFDNLEAIAEFLNTQQKEYLKKEQPFDFTLSRLSLEMTEKWKEWCKQLPYFNFPKDWNVQIIPPFGGALVRFYIKYKDCFASIYCDVFNNLGYEDNPYWEIYIANSKDPERFSLDDSDKIVDFIKENFSKNTIPKKDSYRMGYNDSFLF